MDTTDPSMKAAYLASAELALESKNSFTTMALIFLSVAPIIIGLVLLKGVFGKRIEYVVIFAGILTLSTNHRINPNSRLANSRWCQTLQTGQRLLAISPHI